MVVRKGLKERVFLIGIPHFDWKIVKLLIKTGKAKNLKKLIKSGCSGEMLPQQTLCSSPVEFTSIVTGVYKEKHGIGYGKHSDGEYIDSGKLYTRLDIKVKPIWDITLKYGKKVGIYHWLLSWPAKRINGFMVTGRNSQDDEHKTYPKKLRRILWVEYPPEPDFFDERAAMMLVKKYNVDLFIGMEERMHGPVHECWKYIDCKKITNKTKKFLDLFKHVDSFLGKVKEEFPEATVMIVTDSGMRVRKHVIYTLGNETIELSRKLGIDLQLYAIDVYPPNLPKAKPTIYLPGKSEREKKRIEKILSKIKYPNGERFIKNIRWYGDNISFSFNFRPSFVNYKTGWLNIILPNGEKFRIWTTKQTGVAIPKNGFFCIEGPRIKRNSYIGKVNVVDIAPTILYLLGLPIPKWMDGKVLKRVIK